MPPPITADAYDVTVAIGGSRSGVVEYPIEVRGVDLSGHGIDLILGWDILARCVLKCDGPRGKFALRY